jgi:hypothetical protein
MEKKKSAEKQRFNRDAAAEIMQEKKEKLERKQRAYQVRR